MLFVFKIIMITCKRIAFSAVLGVSLTVGLMPGSSYADTLEFPIIKAESIDGTPTTAEFVLVVSSSTSTARLTTQQVLDVSLRVTPDPRHGDRAGAVYAVLVKDNTFFLLSPDRRFTNWNGQVETLHPFSENVKLANSSVALLSGRLSDPGEYQLFTAYLPDGSAALEFTPEPFIFSINAAAQAPPSEDAIRLFDTKVESGIVQTRCVACHVSGGAARNSALRFQRSMPGSALNNLSALQSYLEVAGNSAETLLRKATGGASHPGGQQLTEGSSEYVSIAQVLKILEQDKAQQTRSISYSFDQSNANTSSMGAQALLSTVTLEPREATLRRATILFAGRAPTAQELRIVRDGDDNTLRASVRQLMAGPAFRAFVVDASNERLLTEGADEPINSNFSNFPVLRNLRYDSDVADQTGQNFWRVYGQRILIAGRRTAGELIAHVLIGELPYSEILTANYMMMNPLLNQVLGGTASFPANAGDKDFVPSRITRYYFPAELVTEQHPRAGFRVKSTGTPLADYPHAGLLTDFGFLSRYPTTATNRNRARARWSLFHFLGIDIEKSSQRPTDEAALADRNNPTMTNPNCSVCHAVLDPVAGAFQNWSEFNMYRQGGTDALDGFYKNPQDGSRGLYRPGDLWYRDMRDPGLFETKISSRDSTLRELAQLIVKEPAFLKASAQFWWPAIFGPHMTQIPAVESDRGFDAKNAAYQAQQASLAEFASVLGQRMNAKDMLVEMVMSPWFSADTTTSYEFRAIQMEANLGAERLLTPRQLAAKTLNLTGVAWRSNGSPSGAFYSGYDQLQVLLGGIDSVAVLERASSLTPSISAILETHAAEVSCPAVVKEFERPRSERQLLSLVDESMTPLGLASNRFDVVTKTSTDWQDFRSNARIPASGAVISVSFANPYCDYDGVKCLEQRVLFIDAITLRHASGVQQRFEANAPEVSMRGQHCYLNGSDATFYADCTLSLGVKLESAYDLDVIVHMAAQQAPSREERVQAIVDVSSTEDILTATTINAGRIKEQIAEMFMKLHGKRYSIDSLEVQQTYSLFAVAQESARLRGRTSINNCPIWIDGNFFTDVLTPQQLSLARTPSKQLNSDHWEIDWNYAGPLISRMTSDPRGAKHGWIAVLAYMLSHYDYMHE